MKNKRGLICITTGLLLIAAALAIIGYNAWEDKQADKAVRNVMEQLKITIPNQTDAEEPDTEAAAETVPAEEEIPDYILNPNMEMPEESINGYDYIGIVEIAACDIELPVISEWNYPSLKVAPCRFEGSVYTDDLIIAGHDYRAHFKGLHDLSGGEKVVFTDMAGNTFAYKVVSVETISGTDVEALTAGEWDLSLFTCTIDGASRVVVRCEKNVNE